MSTCPVRCLASGGDPQQLCAWQSCAASGYFRKWLWPPELAWEPAHVAGLQATTLAFTPTSLMVLPFLFLFFWKKKKKKKKAASNQCFRQVYSVSSIGMGHQLSSSHGSQEEYVFWTLSAEKFYVRMFIKIVCPLEGCFAHQMSRQFLCSGLNTALPMLVSCLAG